MPFSIVKSTGRQILKLEGAITILHSQEFAARLGEGLDNVVPVEVQTSGGTVLAPALNPSEEADLDAALIETYAKAGITNDPLTHTSEPPTISIGPVVTKLRPASRPRIQSS